MTNEQRMMIVSLRKKGQGYMSIANTLGISANTVKSFCRRTEKKGSGTDFSVDEHKCKCCGKPVLQAPGRKEKKFCSDSCRIKWWNSHLDQVDRRAIYKKECPGCGKSFSVYGNAGRKYCCHACYIKDRFGGGEDE